MSRRLVLLAALFALTAWGVGASAALPPGYEYEPGEIIIKFKPGISSVQKDNILSELRSEQLKVFPGIKAEHRRLEGLTVEEAVARFADHPHIEYIQPNWHWYAVNIPNDPRFPDLWGMLNTGQTGGTPGADIRATQAWDVFTGSHDVVVAVIDTGVDWNHPDLATNIYANPGEIPGNGIDDDGNGFVDDVRGWDFRNEDNNPTDDNGHGTHCSGTIGGIGNNAVGVAGVNWNVSIMPLKFLSSAGSGTTADAIECIEYATMMGVDIMSNSWGGGPFDTAMEQAITNAYNAGIFFVAAAGNSGVNTDSTPFYPSCYTVPNVISVMATDHNDNRVNEPGWWASNYGATTVDLAAPGLHIWSTTPNNTYDDYSGTSMACPHVAGALALLRGRFPTMSVDAGKELLLTLGVDQLPQLNGLNVSGGRLNAFMLIADPDTIPPGQIIDLAVTQVASNWVDLAWTATGDDGDEGTASRYDLRYSTSPIDETNWDSATQVAGEPNPQVAGSAESMRVSGLVHDTTYYFAIVARDEYGTPGPLSNNASDTTLGAPIIALSPLAMEETLPTGGTASQTLTISNVGEGVLDFTIPGAEYIMPAKRALPAQAEYIELPKGAADPFTGEPVVNGSGGPDAFGYRWKDSDDPGGPAFNWIDISGVGTALTMTDDTNQGPFDIGFTFPFYGNDFTTFRVCSNGFISFTSTATAYSNSGLPSSGAPVNLVAPFWDDLNPGGQPNIFYHNDGTRLIVQYHNVPAYASGSGPYTFQVHLYPSGLIEYHYLTMNAGLTSATVGIQNADGTDGLQIAYNAAYIHDNLAVRIGAMPPWLSASPNSGSVPAGESADVTVGFDASGLCGDQFLANLHVLSNDPVTPDAVMAATLNLIAEPDGLVTPAALDFGDVYVTGTAVLPVTVTNNGCASLNVTEIAITGDFSVDTTPFAVPAGAGQPLPVTFAPTFAGPHTGVLTITTDDPDTPVFTVDLAGVGLDYPAIAVSPESLTETLPTGGTSTQILTISNTGAGALNFTIPEPEYISGDKAARPDSPPIELGKDDVDPRPGIPVANGAGGPDNFGYRWVDSDEPGGPAFNWIEIRNVGTQVTLTDDSNQGPFNIGFTFPFYGSDFTTFRICSNGWISFTSTLSSLTNYALPSTSAPENLLALFWDDLNPGAGGSVWYHNDGTRLIVEYYQVPRFSSGGPYTMQVHLYPSGRIEYHYLSMQGTRLNEATIGIQNAARDDGLTVVFNANYVHDNMAIRFQAQEPWLSATPSAGTVLPGDSVEITVGFNAAGLCGDQFLANLHVLSNDPTSPNVTVPVTLNLIAEPDIMVAPAALDFGDVYLTQDASLPLSVANAGCATLTVKNIVSDNEVFTVTPASFTVAPGATQVVTVTFTPDAVGAAAGELTITSNDPLDPAVTVALAGNGLATPGIAVYPTSLTQGVPFGGQRQRTVTISNNGDGELNFTIPSPDLYSKLAAAPAKAQQPLDLAKGEADPRVGDLLANGFGGPDAYGYRWKDSDEPGGPVFNWIDISGYGTPLTMGDDTNLGPFPIGFTFKFYGNQFNTFRVCSNGWLSFSSTMTSYTNQPLPYASGPFDLVAPFWDDLNLTSSGSVHYHSDGTRLIVQWTNVPHYGTGGPYTYQAIIYPNGSMVFQYLTMAAPLNSATIGIQNSNGTVGLQVVFNAEYVHNNLAIRIAAMPEWLTVEPTAGVVPAHSSVDVTVTFNAEGMDYGIHEGMLRILSNDLVTPMVEIPVTMNVSDLTAVEDELPMPTASMLHQNIPNPFNPATTIKFALPAAVRVDLRIYDVRGTLVRALVDGELPAGNHAVLWDGRDGSNQQVASGVYFYRLKAGDYESMRRMVLVK